MTTRSLPRRKAKPTPSGQSLVAADAQDVAERLLEISCRVAVCSHSAEYLEDGESPDALRSAMAALPVVLGEIRRDLMDLVDRLQRAQVES